jgi:hypothetical protein
MASLTIEAMEPSLWEALEERARRMGLSVEEVAAAMLREGLLGGPTGASEETMAQLLAWRARNAALLPELEGTFEGLREREVEREEDPL